MMMVSSGIMMSFARPFLNLASKPGRSASTSARVLPSMRSLAFTGKCTLVKTMSAALTLAPRLAAMAFFILSWLSLSTLRTPLNFIAVLTFFLLGFLTPKKSISCLSAAQDSGVVSFWHVCITFHRFLPSSSPAIASNSAGIMHSSSNTSSPWPAQADAGSSAALSATSMGDGHCLEEPGISADISTDMNALSSASHLSCW
mmetsp:Transcript_23966/g.58735  ORF Transcript_23966/g.58735 Transcript_23966/m.58735 type:complete len:201 (-) Transcript_23966:1449-2051(-)